jgi:hypothetical protein
MENFAKDLISAFQYLLPGFLAAWVFYGFTSFPKPSQFERVVQALIFTLIIQLLVFIEKSAALRVGELLLIGDWTNRWELGCSAITAIILGGLFAYFANNDKFHKLARKIGLTRETSYPSEWFGAFLKNVTYVVLHLKDERRLYGWPIEWPSEPDKGHFVLEQPSWLDEDKEIPITGVSSVMVNVKDVKWVEFMEKIWEENDGEKRLQSTATTSTKTGGSRESTQ